MDEEGPPRIDDGHRPGVLLLKPAHPLRGALYPKERHFFIAVGMQQSVGELQSFLMEFFG